MPRALMFLIFLGMLRLSTVSSTPTASLNDGRSKSEELLMPKIPDFLGGAPRNVQEHIYSPKQRGSNHTAEGRGLHNARTGQSASFTIHLVPQDEDPPNSVWNIQQGTFFYVWIANEEQIFIAEVTNNIDGTLTATYESDFPGRYLIYVEAVIIEKHDEGVPIVGSPFALTIAGDPTVDIDSLPVCSTAQDEERTPEAFWKPGTWISSRLASAKHGVARDGWVFQPKTCVHDAFSYDDLMLLASLEETTWLLVLGSSIQRGVFLTLVDMVLAQGQKDDMDSSVIAKCWGYADITVGNLRITYQDMRLSIANGMGNAVECNNEKLVSGSTSVFRRSAEGFLASSVFADGEAWPSVLFTPSFLVFDGESPNNAIEDSILETENPTRTALRDVGITKFCVMPSDRTGLGRMATYHQRDPRVTFMSPFPIYQAKLFENASTKRGIRRYGGSRHYHYIMSLDDVETYRGAMMVHSTITEMLSHIIIATAVGSKADLYEKAAAIQDISGKSAAARLSFKICTDCPAGLLPFHVKPVPEPVCETATSLQGDARVGNVWNNELCPDWCMATEPVGKTPTESGMVDVRVCKEDG